jgi:hypothetical protein
MSISEPNTILEINESFSDNFILVIPKIPTLKYLGSVFNDFSNPKKMTTPSPSSTEESCDTYSKDRIQREVNIDLKNFMLYISEVSLPGANVGKIDIPTQFSTMKRPSSKIEFDDIEINMRVSENLLNYNAILYWLYALANPEEFNKLFGGEMINEFFVNMHLIITNNHREKIAEFTFLDAFPTNIGKLPLTFKSADPLFTSVSWSHSGMVPSNNFVLKYV